MKLSALLFDYGGTLDAPGLPWVERFLEIYAEYGVRESETRIREAFGHATRCAYADERLRQFDLEATVAFQVERQQEYLGNQDSRLAANVVAEFVRRARNDLDHSRQILERLQPRFALGVVSNFYGNVELLLEEAGITPLLSVVVDSTCAGVSKPDPAIFRVALAAVGTTPGETLYVGDSFEKDIVGARAAGLRTAWLMGAVERDCPNRALVDLRLRSLDELVDLCR